MVKKIIICSVLCQLSLHIHAQFFRGIGLFVGVTESSHRYVNTHPEDDTTFLHTYAAPSHRSAEYFNFSVGLLGEFLKYDHVRWQTEIEFCNKGAIERPLLNRYTGDRGPAVANSYGNLQWNNYLKYFFNEGYRGTPYIMLGARIEYNVMRATPAYAAVSGAVPKLSVTPDVALGFEFISYNKFKPFVELHYNPDLIKLHVGDVTMWNRTLELRVGIIFRPKKALDDCNAPRFRGKNY